MRQEAAQLAALLVPHIVVKLDVARPRRQDLAREDAQEVPDGCAATAQTELGSCALNLFEAAHATTGATAVIIRRVWSRLERLKKPQRGQGNEQFRVGNPLAIQTWATQARVSKTLAHTRMDHA